MLGSRASLSQIALINEIVGCSEVVSRDSKVCIRYDNV